VKAFKFHLSIEHLWGLTALVGIFVFVNTHPIRPHDFWWHITIGREILATRTIPAVDIYTYTAQGMPYPSYQMFWLMDIVLYSIYKLGGPALVVFIHSLMITSAYLVIFWICRLLSKSNRIAAFGVLFAAALGLNDWNVRPQGITFLLASLFMLAIVEFRQTHRWGWLAIIPAGMLLWANSHGTFIIGLVLVGIWLGQEGWGMIKPHLQHERLPPVRELYAPLITFIITALACFFNPRGFGTVDYIKTLTGNSVVQNLVTEWAPPTINSLMGVLFFSGLLICAVVLVISPKRPALSQTVTFIVFGVLGLTTSRGIVWFGLVMAPILAEHISYLIQRYQKARNPSMANPGSAKLNTIFSSVIILMGLLSLPWFKSALPLPEAKAGLISAETPIESTQTLLEINPPGRLFNGISFGSYLIWAAYPQYQVFVDSRIELFSEEVWLDYLRISNAIEGWEFLLEKYEVNTLMLSLVEQPALIQAADKSGEWKLLFSDGVADIFVRNPIDQEH